MAVGATVTYAVDALTGNARPAPGASAAPSAFSAAAIAPMVTVQANDPETAALHVVLPEVARAMADSTVSAIARRLDQARRGAATGQATLGGVALGHRSLTDSVADFVTTHGRAVADGAVDLTALLTNSDFVLPLTAGAGAGPGVALWGSGDYRSLSGSSDELNWDGAPDRRAPGRGRALVRRLAGRRRRLLDAGEPEQHHHRRRRIRPGSA